MILYLIFWFVFLSATVISVFVNKPQRKTLFFISTLSLSLISGLRYYSANDYDSYTWLYSITPFIGAGLTKFQEVPVELGFVFINSLFKTAGLENYLFLFILAFISIGLKSYIFSKFSKLSLASLFIYFSLVFYNSEFIQIRWALALAILYFALYYLASKCYFRSLVLLILASFIHVTSIMLFPIFIITVLSIRFNFINGLSFLVFCAFCTSFILDMTDFIKSSPLLSYGGYFIVKLQSYLNNVEEAISWHVSLRYFFSFILVSFIYSYRVKQLSPTDTMSFFEKTLYSAFYGSVLVCFVFLSFPMLANRLFIFSDFIFSILLINYLVDRKEINLRVSFLLAVLFLFFVYGVLLQNSMFNKQYLYEYKTWLGVVF
ncbi:MAG: hypothetical protein ACI9LM_004302 [Alteromonadaceae bacterium]|jgi:hypothetical protein